MGEHVNGRVYNTVAWAFSIALIGLSVTLVASPFLLPEPPASHAGAQLPSSRSCERGSMCTSTSALGTQSRMSAAMCSAISCASATVMRLVDGDVQVDVAAAARLTRAQLVVAPDEVAAVVGDQRRMTSSSSSGSVWSSSTRVDCTTSW